DYYCYSTETNGNRGLF
nr:immunoglobulin light chain junction region [Macaca mulatta]MOX33412.1 immunoglobulin light chain junction region [Macaca mulatta]MOX33425.1 immunoglobulin light chain junction region [Macaca mulatta]MOX33448.1 immunoglobulin light chain junction region [Macaca mulatta]MOX33462.1 immunoglobulin light chain junction region [Macaca mulatta]